MGGVLWNTSVIPQKPGRMARFALRVDLFRAWKYAPAGVSAPDETRGAVRPRRENEGLI